MQTSLYCCCSNGIKRKYEHYVHSLEYPKIHIRAEPLRQSGNGIRKNYYCYCREWWIVFIHHTNRVCTISLASSASLEYLLVLCVRLCDMWRSNPVVWHTTQNTSFDCIRFHSCEFVQRREYWNTCMGGWRRHQMTWDFFRKFGLQTE